jgi:hypothetical protein
MVMGIENIIGFSENYSKFKNWLVNADPGTSIPDSLRTYKDKIDAAHSFLNKLGHLGKGQKWIASQLANILEVNLREAQQLVYEAMHLYYAEASMTKEIYINHTIEKLEKLIASCIVIGDYRSVGKFIEIQNKLKRVDIDEKVFPAEYFRQPILVMTITPEDIGIKRENRSIIAKQIDAMKLNKEDRNRIRLEAGLPVELNNISDATEVL